MQLDDIQKELNAWFPPEAHKERKLPGGGKWFYLSHQAIRDRLNEVCFGYWQDEISPPVISGDYVTVCCKLTICGITRTGIADNKTYPELNDEGKAKIIGSPIVNAARHAFRDAAEKFGAGAYLDEQKGETRNKFVAYMSKKGDYRAKNFAQTNEWVESGAMGVATAKPKPQEKPGAFLDALSDKPAKVVQSPTVGLFPRHNSLVKQVRAVTGHSPEQIIDWCKSKGCMEPAQLNPEQCNELLRAIALSWAKPKFQNEQLAQTAFDGYVEVLAKSETSYGEAVLSWLDKQMAVKN